MIFAITFGQTIRSKKTVFMLIVTFFPVLLAAYYRISGSEASISPEHAFSQIMIFFLLFISILVALFYGTAVIADEIDNKTITYLFMRPIRKHLIILGKFAAYILGVFLILIPPMLFTFLIIVTHSKMPSDFAHSLSLFTQRLCVVLLSLTVYGAIFTFFGTWLRRPVLLGLLLAFGWEKIALIVPGTIRKFSVAHYLLSVFPEAPSMQRFMHLPKEASSSSPVLFSIIILSIITCIFLGLSIFTIYRKEYRFE